jgi:hypothetical protein
MITPRCSEWKSATIASGGTVSGEVDLGGNYSRILVLIPTIDSATITPSVAMASGGTFFAMEALDADATGSFAHATTAGTGGEAVIFNIGGAQYVKLTAGAAQSSGAVTLYVRGIP